MSVIYDSIGEGYDTTRKADPVILAELARLLNIQASKRYLDVACGTGNYTAEISKLGGTWDAFDQSEKMLAEARPKSKIVKWHQFDVSELGFKSASFDGAITTLTIHHFPSIRNAFAEISRVLKPMTDFVIFTTTPEQMRSYWLFHYFPEMMEKSCKDIPTLEEIKDAFEPAGLEITATTPFCVGTELQDCFLYCGKQRPLMYLSEEVRAGISSFRNFCSEAELANGLAQLENDIESGMISAVIGSYHSDIGDYLFISARRTE